MTAEQGFAMRPFPKGHKGLTLVANGKLDPAGEPYLAMITSAGNQLTVVLPRRPAVALRCSVKLIDVEREHILTVLESTKWRIRGTGGAAEQLGLKPTTLETRMTKLGLSRPRPA